MHGECPAANLAEKTNPQALWASCRWPCTAEGLVPGVCAACAAGAACAACLCRKALTAEGRHAHAECVPPLDEDLLLDFTEHLAWTADIARDEGEAHGQLDHLRGEDGHAAQVELSAGHAHDTGLPSENGREGVLKHEQRQDKILERKLQSAERKLLLVQAFVVLGCRSRHRRRSRARNVEHIERRRMR